MKTAMKTAVVAWLVTAVYYFHQYMMRSAPSLMTFFLRETGPAMRSSAPLAAEVKA